MFNMFDMSHTNVRPETYIARVIRKEMAWLLFYAMLFLGKNIFTTTSICPAWKRHYIPEGPCSQRVIHGLPSQVQKSAPHYTEAAYDEIELLAEAGERSDWSNLAFDLG